MTVWLANRRALARKAQGKDTCVEALQHSLNSPRYGADEFRASFNVVLANRHARFARSERHLYVLAGSSSSNRPGGVPVTTTGQVCLCKAQGFFYHVLCEERPVYDALVAAAKSRHLTWQRILSMEFEELVEASERLLDCGLIARTETITRGGHQHIIVVLLRQGSGQGLLMSTRLASICKGIGHLGHDRPVFDQIATCLLATNHLAASFEVQ
jgi:hypothetical protein